MPPSSGEKRKSTFDLKNQLSDLQNKLLDTQQGKETRNRHSTSHLSEIDQFGANSAVPKLPNVFGKRNKDGKSDKRSSLPPMPLSASGSQSGGPGSDVNFVVGLSENLLLECRRLTAENSQFKLQLKETQDDLQRVTKQLTNMSVINKKFMEEEDSFKDKNWELEGTLQQMKEKYDKLNNENLKLSQYKIESEKLAERLKNELELQKLANLNLTEELTLTRQQWTTESKNLKAINEDLNDENDKLHKSVSDLTEQVQLLKTASKRLTSSIPQLTDTSFFNRNDSDSDNEFSVIDDPSSSPIKNGSSRNIELEKETIQSKLVHSNQTITKLRSTIMKLRGEKEELEKRVSASSKASAIYHSPLNKNKKLKNLKSPPSLLSKRASKVLSYDDSDTTNTEKWEDYSFNNSPEVLPGSKDSSSSDEDDTTTNTGSNRKLLSQELAADPRDLVNRYIAENNLVLIDRNEYDHLKDIDTKHSSYQQQNAAIVTAAEQYNILALPRSDGTHQLHIPVLLLKQKCEEENLVLLDKEDYEELMETVKYEPTEAELIERISKYNKVVLPLDEHEKLITITNDPPLEFLQDNLMKHYSQVSVNQDEYELLKSPSLEFLQDNLSKRYNQVSIDQKEYKSLKNPSLDRVKDLASHYKHVAIPAEQHERLLNINESPSLEFLQSKLQEDHQHILLHKDDYESLKEPSLNRLKELATQKSHVTIPIEEHAQLANTLSAPSLNFLRDNLMQKHDHVLLSQGDYDSLKNPSLEQIRQHASETDHVVIPASQHALLVQKSTEPTIEELKTFAELHSHTTLPKDVYQKLHDQLTTPSSSQLYKYATAAGLVLLSQDDHSKLATIAKTPSLLFLSSKLENLNHVIVSDDEFNQLKKSADETAQEKAERDNALVIPKEDLESLQNERDELLRKLDTPDVEYLKEKASHHSHVVIDSNEYQDLFDSHNTPLSKKAEAAGQVLVDSTQHSRDMKLLEQPSLEFLKEKSQPFGMSLIKSEELVSLKEAKLLMESPTDEFLNSKASEKGHKLLSDEEFSKLKYLETKEGITDLAAKLDLAVVQTTELSDLIALKNRISNISVADVNEFASKLNLTAVDNVELLKLKQVTYDPTVEDIKSHEEKLNVAIISSDEYSRLNAVAAQAVEQREILDRAEPETVSDMASKAGLIALTISDHEKLKKSADESLEQKAKRLNHVVIPLDEHLSLLAHSSELSSKVEDYQKLVEEKADLLSQLDTPSTDYLESKAHENGLLLVKQKELDELNLLNSESLDVKAAREDKVLLSTDEHRQLLKSIHEPSLEFLAEKASKVSYDLLPTDELELLRRQLSSPTEEELEAHAKSRGSTILAQEKYDEWTSAVTNPSLTFLQEKAASLNHAVIPEEVYSNLLAIEKETLPEKAEKADSIILSKNNYKRLSLLEESPSLDFLKEKAQILGHEVINAEYLKELKDLNEEPLLSKANKEGKILLSGDEYASLTSKNEELEKEIESYQDKERNPDEESLVKAATALGLVVLKSEDFTNLSQAAASPSLDQLMGHASKKDHVLLAKWKYDILERKATSPNDDELKTFASNKGLTLIQPDELKRLTLEASSPSRDVLNKAAAALGLVLLASKEHELLIEKFKSRPSPIETGVENLPLVAEESALPTSPTSPTTLMKSKVLSSKEHYEELIRQENEKKQQRQKAAASKALGIVSLSTDEYKRLLAQQHISEPTISDIYNGAKSFGLTVLPQTDYKALLKRQNSVETREDLDSAARLLGFTIIPLTAIRNGSVVSLSDEDDFHDALSHQGSKVSLSSNDVYEDALSRQITQADESSHFTDALSLDDLRERATDFGFKLVPLDDDGSEDDTTSIEDNDFEETIHGRSIINEPSVSAAEYEELEKQLKEASLKLNELENRKITDTEIILLAPTYGLVAIPRQEYDNLKKELTNEELADIAASRNLVIISKEEHEKLLEQSAKSNAIPTIPSVSALAAAVGLSVLPSIELDSLRQNQIKNITDDDFDKIVSDKGMVAVQKSDYENMRSVVTDENLREIASERGFTLLSLDEYASLKNTADNLPEGPTEEDIQKFLSNEGLVTLTKQQYDELQELVLNSSKSPTTDELRKLAVLLGLIVLSSDEYTSLQNHKVTEMEIMDGAPEFGLAVIPQSRLLELEAPHVLSVDELQTNANDNGMSVISTKELESLRNAEISANTLAVKAALLDLVLVPQDTYEALKASGLSGEGLENAARKLGMICVPETLYVPTTVAPSPDPRNVVILPKTYYNKLARSHTLSVERLSKEELIEHCKQRGILLAGEQFNFENDGSNSAQVRSQHSPQSSYHSPVFNNYRATTPTQTTPKSNSNMVSSPSLFSIATNVSLTDRKMIPALTQTIIGEYLYKYYRRLGPFSSISENRHERYFWIHPYSLTLYWSATNPVLGDPSTNKIRAAAILRVQEVEDNNPLPPGLYHKSIIVHSSERSIKITCPTRQRHNVWYNSLRYLIERTTDGLDLSQTFDHKQQNDLPSTIEEDEDEDNNDIDTYRYIKPRSSMVRPLRVVSNPTRKNSRIFSTSGISRSATSSTLHRKS